MTMISGIRHIEFDGPLKNAIGEFIEYKRVLGNKYNIECSYLLAIANLATVMNIAENQLSKELVQTFAMKRPAESEKTWKNRIVIIRQLARFMNTKGFHAYESIISTKGKVSDFTPYIFNKRELVLFFKASDNCPVYTNCPSRRMVVSLLFRMLYSCGLRVSEALHLTLGDVDLKNGILTINDSKFGKSRYVPMSEELTIRCNNYTNMVHPFVNGNPIFFPTPNGMVYTHTAIYSTFRQLLFLSGIPHSDNGPRIHDFRHTFSVECLKKWIYEGKDITALLPVLSAYLGHKNLGGTQKYLRLTADMFPDITSKVQNQFGDIIPIGGIENETF